MVVRAEDHPLGTLQVDECRECVARFAERDHLGRDSQLAHGQDALLHA